MLRAVDAAAAAATVPWPQLVAGSIITALVGVVAFGVRAILKGDLVPRKVFEGETARADKWESSYNRSQDNFGTYGGRLDAIEEGLKTIEKALTAVTDQMHREHS